MTMRLPKPLLLLAAVALLSGPVSGQTKIATVDLKKCFDNYWKTKQADANLKERAADMDKARKGMVDDFQKANDEYKLLLDGANDQAVAATERDKRKAAAEAKLTEIGQLKQNIDAFDRQARTTLAESQRRLRDNLLKEIRDLVTAKAKARGYAMVLDTAAETRNETPVLLFSTNENDLTEEVVKELNVGAPPITPAAGAGAAPAPAAPPAKKQ
jgi:outer membrane protein